MFRDSLIKPTFPGFSGQQFAPLFPEKSTLNWHWGLQFPRVFYTREHNERGDDREGDDARWRPSFEKSGGASTGKKEEEEEEGRV